MCVASGQSAEFKNAAHGSTCVTLPVASTRKPVGSFIHPFADTTKNADIMPAKPIGTPLHKCTRAGMRSQP